MQIGKKAALMAAAAGAIVIGTAGGASAYGPLFGSGGAVQSNSCDTTTGMIATTGNVSSTGDVNVGSDCVNFTNSGAVAQSNDCDVTTGPIATTGNPSPAGEVNVGRPCTNIALAQPGNGNKAKKSSKKSRY
ncbi:hypothetical protein [Streptomyces sp. ME19-01-6]|uniref:hypothetical protein n=1 Tax=Streptomyces sp. ME19-01-6 TaxID=3028686 RepID=UPI0029B685B3|nr:hypothetical protein [Streptomyces sp. ME19-01-6]MDX3231173.1 hypothetical protein [Streptomyces sp. ME19-01-6]